MPGSRVLLTLFFPAIFFFFLKNVPVLGYGFCFFVLPIRVFFISFVYYFFFSFNSPLFPGELFLKLSEGNVNLLRHGMLPPNHFSSLDDVEGKRARLNSPERPACLWSRGNCSRP